MKTVVTHPSTFHADDVFAIATFFMAHAGEEWQLVRSSDPAVIASADCVFDIGGEYDPARMRFDHHQEGGAGARDNGMPYAAFGLAWKHFGEKVAGSAEAARRIEMDMVAAMDSSDIGIDVMVPKTPGISLFSLPAVIAIFNQTWKEVEASGTSFHAVQDERFNELVSMGKLILGRLVKRTQDAIEAEALVLAAYESATDKRIVILEKEYPWQDVLMNLPEPLYCIYQDNRGGWGAKAVRARRGSMESRLPFPEAWRGKRDGDAAAATGIPDAIFCHNSGFLAVAKSKEGALALAQKSLELSNN
jgi:uncharacterized UPF0160 family protein